MDWSVYVETAVYGRPFHPFKAKQWFKVHRLRDPISSWIGRSIFHSHFRRCSVAIAGRFCVGGQMGTAFLAKSALKTCFLSSLIEGI